MNKRVLLVVENESVPTDRRVWDQATILRDHGYEVTVISPMGLTTDFAAHETIDGIEVLRFKLTPARGGAVGYAKEYGTALWRMLRATFKVGRVDVIHVSNPPDFLFLLGLVPKLRWGTKIIFDHHDLSPELFETRFDSASPLLRAVRVLERVNFAVVDAVISTNESYRKLAIERGHKNPDAVRVVRNARHGGDFAPTTPDPTLKEGRPLMAVYVGAMGPQDGADAAVRVAAHYRNNLGRDDITFVLVGDGDAKAEAEVLAKELEVDDCVTFTGWLNRDEVIRYLSSADIGLATDPPGPLNDRSTMIKVVEYLAMGLPVVSFDLPESVISAGDAALYSPGGDEADMAAQLARLADEPELRATLSQRALQRSADELSWETSRQALLDTYNYVVQDR